MLVLSMLQVIYIGDAITIGDSTTFTNVAYRIYIDTLNSTSLTTSINTSS